jgi:electron transfer flavoprotein beta subunit
MKLLVCISKTPETTARIAFSEDNSTFNGEGVNFIMNPYDEWYALVRALELKEKHGGTVTVINVGPASNDIVIRKALAIGADDAIRVDAEPEDAFYTASQIAAQARDAGYDIVFTGKETIDHNGSEVGGMLGELLSVPFVSYANHLEVEGDKLVIDREIDGGIQVVELSTPCVISAAKGLADQRIPNMRGIMMAKRKPLNVVTPEDISPRATPVSFELPPAKSSVKMVEPDNMDELVRLLHEEAKVI